MHISATEEYGLRCILQVAKQLDPVPISASEVAALEGISVEYVSKFMHLFKKAGLVQAQRGVQGGFTLALPPQDISLQRIFDALKSKKEEEAVASFCGQFAGKNETCVHIEQCSVRPFWNVLSYYFDEVTKSLTLADLILRENESTHRVKHVIDEKVSRLMQVIRPSKSTKELT